MQNVDGLRPAVGCVNLAHLNTPAAEPLLIRHSAFIILHSFRIRFMLFLAIDHPAIACYDVKRQIEWYCKHLGMRVVASNGQDPPSAVVGYDADARGGAMIELMPAREPGPPPQDVPRFSPGVRHIALRVSDF